ncbi:hypothetical protein [Clostridium rectalis]|uniref:hypothetical protein n=1 Tax=Clostridium rectalis TaxID=2040295 RepID=UPI0013DE1E10|nr:hypothetical protein [Clostridium rectalis]
MIKKVIVVMLCSLLLVGGTINVKAGSRMSNRSKNTTRKELSINNIWYDDMK